MTTATVTNAEDLLSLIPSLLGKYPTAGESVIVLIKDGRVALCVRQDNEPMLNTDPDMFAAYMGLAFANSGAQQYVFVGYMDDANDQSLYHHAFALQQHGEMLDVLTVGRNQYTNVREDIIFDLPSAVLLGDEPVLDRSHLYSMYQDKTYRNHKSVMSTTLALLADADAQLNDRYVLMAQTEKLNDGELVSVGTSLLSMKVRDTLMYDIANMGLGECLFMYERMANVCSVMPGKYKAPAATTAAIAAYLAGDGMRANVALDVASTHDPDYPLKDLVQEFLARAMSPTQMRELLTSFEREELLGE